MNTRKMLARAVLVAATAAVLIAPGAHADVDTDFASQLHTYGIYGARDYNAWIAKITCERLATHVDADAFKSAAFLKTNLDRTSSTQQVWQFLGAAVATYCPDQTPVLRSAAESSSHPMEEQR